MKGKYDRYDPEPVAGSSPGYLKRCPWCGGRLTETTEVVTLDGRHGTVSSLAPPEFRGWSGVRLYHPRCRQKRRIWKLRVESARLSTFLGDD